LKTGEIELRLAVNQALGNCPSTSPLSIGLALKVTSITLASEYINVRELVPKERNSRVLSSNLSRLPGGEPLPPAAISHISGADTVFLATRYLPSQEAETSHLGLNHRGGARPLLSLSRAWPDCTISDIAAFLQANRGLSGLTLFRATHSTSPTFPVTVSCRCVSGS
jgi:hypothetical protein